MYKSIAIAISVRTSSVTCVTPPRFFITNLLGVDEEDWLVLLLKDGTLTQTSLDKLDTLAKARAHAKGHISWKRLRDTWLETLEAHL